MRVTVVDARPVFATPERFPDADEVVDYAGASGQDTAAFAAFFHAMLDAGVYLPPSAFQAWFLSSAHDDRAVQTEGAAVARADDLATGDLGYRAPGMRALCGQPLEDAGRGLGEDDIVDDET